MTAEIDSSARVAYQGEVGAFSEEAAGLLFPDAEPAAFPTFEAVFEALVAGSTGDPGRNAPSTATHGDEPDRTLVTAAVIPIENTLFGSVHVNYDLLREHDVRITGEVYLRIRHNLLVNPRTKLADIRSVLSHPQALGQCRAYLKKHLPDAEQVSVYDTAGAAKRVSEQVLRDAAAIASARAAEVYGLEVLADSIETDHRNYTRFLLLEPPAEARVTGKRKAKGERGGEARTSSSGQSSIMNHESSIGSSSGPARRKTSIVYALAHTAPGSLFETLAVFADRSVDLLKIESRPLVGDPGSYLFYLDLDGGEDAANVRSALEELRNMADLVKVLGSYPRGLWVDGDVSSEQPRLEK